MLDKLFGRTKAAPQKEVNARKDIVVRIVNASNKPRNASVINEAELVEDYKNEVKLAKPVNLAQGLSVGAGIGILVCAIAGVIGIGLNTGDMAAIVGIPAVLGLIAGFLLS